MHMGWKPWETTKEICSSTDCTNSETTLWRFTRMATSSGSLCTDSTRPGETTKPRRTLGGNTPVSSNCRSTSRNCWALITDFPPPEWPPGHNLNPNRQKEVKGCCGPLLHHPPKLPKVFSREPHHDPQKRIQGQFHVRWHEQICHCHSMGPTGPENRQRMLDHSIKTTLMQGMLYRLLHSTHWELLSPRMWAQ